MRASLNGGGGVGIALPVTTKEVDLQTTLKHFAKPCGFAMKLDDLKARLRLPQRHFRGSLSLATARAIHFG